MERGHSRVRKEKGAVGKMIDSFKEVRQDEKAYTFFERHQDLNRNQQPLPEPYKEKGE